MLSILTIGLFCRCGLIDEKTTETEIESEKDKYTERGRQIGRQTDRETEKERERDRKTNTDRRLHGNAGITSLVWK